MNFESCCGSAFSSAVKPAVDSNDLHDAIEHALGHLGAERLDQQLLRVLDAAARRRTPPPPHVVELVEHVLAGLRRATLPSDRDLAGDLLDLVLAEVLEHLGRGLLAEQQRERWRPCGRRSSR